MADTVKTEDEELATRWRHFKKLKVNRKSIKQRARKIENVTLKHAHRFITNRWTNARDVARNTSAWLVAVGLLIGLSFLQSMWFQQSYMVAAPQTGGTYAEGIVGRLETANPLFASSTAEVSASKLIFSSLLDYDADNALRASVAKSWTASPDGKVYTVTMRDDVRWHDGKPLTADDVIFTIQLIQDETVRANQYGSWAGVKAEKRSKYEIVFTLPNLYAPFAHSLTFGILPQHLLKSVTPADLRENDFGRNPVGSGPFVFKRVQLIDPNKDRLVVHMDANKDYFKSKPLLNRFQLHTYEDYAALDRAFRTQEVNAALGLRSTQVAKILATNSGEKAPSVRIADGVYTLLNTSSPLLSDAMLRRALLVGTNRQAIIESIENRADTLEGPLLAEQIGNIEDQQAAYNEAVAKTQLDALGWKLSGDMRKKDTTELALSVVAPDSGDYKTVVDELARQWRELGVKIVVKYVDTKEIASEYLQSRNYDVLVYEFSIGSDPDVYPYWHSSQAKATGLNFANYRSGLADDSLSSARARLDMNLRVAKYRTFTEQWLKDAPAIALYQPWLSYVMASGSTSLENDSSVADLASRYRSVERWSVSEADVMRTP